MATKNEIGCRLKQARQRAEMTLREVAERVGVSNSTVLRYENGDIDKIKLPVIEALSKALGVDAQWVLGKTGIAEDDPPDAPLPYGLLRIKTKKIPLLGTIAAGVPVYAPEDYDAYILADNGLHADFALRVEGDSMMPKFQDNDIVFVREQPDVYDGQVAAVSVDDEATLKRVYHVQGGLQLVSYNTDYPPMLYTEENSDNLRILGLAVGMYRNVR